MLGIRLSVLIALVVGVGLASGVTALSLVTSAITLSTTLNGLDQTVPGTTTAWQVNTFTDNGGWNITVSSTDFSDGGSGTISVSNFDIRQLDSNIVWRAGSQNMPTSAQTTFAALSGTPLKIVTAAQGQAKGIYDITPDFQLFVVGETSPASYDATVTVTIALGP
ncbi:MAG: hypothetical protein IH957_12480 [Chloroflexi bacterium]|nr:hypothetical protein [Chloroflexota bacterium]